MPLAPNAIAEAQSAMSPTEGALRTYIHGDPCPDNLVVDSARRIRLVDFEVGGYANALIDAVYLRMPFPTCWCCGTTPPALTTAFERRYRDRLSDFVAEASSDTLFDTALVDACAAWALRLLGRRINALLDHEPERDPDPWRGFPGPTPREQALVWLDAFVHVAADRDRRPALADAVGRCAEALAERWHTSPPIPFFPAFSQD